MNDVFDVSVPSVHPGDRWYVHETRTIAGGRERHAVRAEGGHYDLVTVTGSRRHVDALLNAYNRDVEGERERAWADLMPTPSVIYPVWSPRPLLVEYMARAAHAARPCRMLAEFMDHC